MESGVHGHSTTIRPERVIRTVLEEITDLPHLIMPQLIERIHDGCLVANDKNIAPCLCVTARRRHICSASTLR
jgi:predicted DNA-binding ribbon-helix-helix protein